MSAKLAEPGQAGALSQGEDSDPLLLAAANIVLEWQYHPEDWRGLRTAEKILNLYRGSMRSSS
jgi:hypothetical protein